MNRSGSPALAAFLVAIFSTFVSSLAHAQPIVIFDGPMSFVVNNPCLADEPVAVEGRQTITVYPRFDQSGGVHLTLRFVSKGKGIVPATLFQPAKEYVFNSESVEEMNAPSNSTVETSLILNHVLVRKSEIDGTSETPFGSGEDFLLKQTVHTTTRNGMLTASVNNGHTRCM